MLLKDKEGKEIEIADDQVQEIVKAQSWYNDELNRIREKGEGATREQLNAEFEKQKKELESLHQKSLEDAKTMSTGKKDEQITLLMEANKETSKKLDDLSNQLLTEKEQTKKTALKSELIKSLSSVTSALSKEALIAKAMDVSLIGEDGKAYFKLSTGTMGSAEELAKEFETSFPDDFKSSQPNGIGLKGGSAGVAPVVAQTEAERVAKINAKFAKL